VITLKKQVFFKPSTINLEKQKTTTIKWSTRKDTGKGKTQKNNQPLDACQRCYVSTCEVTTFVFDKKG